MVQQSTFLQFPSGIQQLDDHINASVQQMLSAQQNGKFIDAESLRLHIDQGRKLLQKRRMNQMASRHNKQTKQLQRAHEQQLENFNNFWNSKIKQFNDEAQACQADLIKRHNDDLVATKKELEKTLPFKYKESAQLLNLKKMLQHMAKQKNYVEAHKVQSKITQLDKVQNQVWQNNRSIKVQNSLNQLKAKQANQLAALRKRILTGLDEQNKQRQKQLERLMQKYNNVSRQLIAQHQKQCLFFKGQFRSKVNVSTAGSMNRSKTRMSGI